MDVFGKDCCISDGWMYLARIAEFHKDGCIWEDFCISQDWIYLTRISAFYEDGCTVFGKD
jgi:hypothetical protein